LSLPIHFAGHYPLSAGSEVHIAGRMSYAPQVAWLQQASIKSNIICCEPWDEARYKAVVHACALEPDFANMLKGDETPIAEKGISLSGGQKQRVGLARAAYRIADVYVLDNPISALDDQTQEHIWTHLIEGLLQQATVIVASSRPVISCTAVLHLTSEGLKSKQPQFFNGWCVEARSTDAPPRYSRSHVTVHENSVNAAQRHSSEAPTMTARCSSAQRPQARMTVEEAAVSDVSAEVGMFEEFASQVQNGPDAAAADAEAKLYQLSLLGESRKSVTFMEQLGESHQFGSKMSQRRSNSFARVVPASALPSIQVDSAAAGPVSTASNNETAEFSASPSPNGFFQWLRACEMGCLFILLLLSSYVLNQFGRSYFAVWATWWNFRTFSLSVSQYHWVFLSLLIAQIIFRVRRICSIVVLVCGELGIALFNTLIRFQPTI
jgi:hypothetical protein